MFTMNLVTKGALLKIVDDRNVITAARQKAIIDTRVAWLKAQRRPDTVSTPRWHREIVAAFAVIRSLD